MGGFFEDPPPDRTVPVIEDGKVIGGIPAPLGPCVVTEVRPYDWIWVDFSSWMHKLNTLLQVLGYERYLEEAHQYHLSRVISTREYSPALGQRYFEIVYERDYITNCGTLYTERITERTQTMGLRVGSVQVYIGRVPPDDEDAPPSIDFPVADPPKEGKVKDQKVAAWAWLGHSRKWGSSVETPDFDQEFENNWPYYNQIPFVETLRRRPDVVQVSDPISYWSTTSIMSYKSHERTYRGVDVMVTFRVV